MFCTFIINIQIGDVVYLGAHAKSKKVIALPFPKRCSPNLAY